MAGSDAMKLMKWFDVVIKGYGKVIAGVSRI